MRSPAEYASFKEAYMDEITTDTKKALQLEKPCIEKIGKAAVTFQDSKSKLGAAFDVAQKSTASLLKSLASIPISVEVSKENITSQEVNVKKSFFSRLRM